MPVKEICYLRRTKLRRVNRSTRPKARLHIREHLEKTYEYIRGVSAWYPRGIRGLSVGYSRGIRGVSPGYPRGIREHLAGVSKGIRGYPGVSGVSAQLREDSPIAPEARSMQFYCVRKEKPQYVRLGRGWCPSERTSCIIILGTKQRLIGRALASPKPASF